LSEQRSANGSELSLTFFTTEGCHLCEQAMDLLVRTPLESPVPVDVVDIAESEILTAVYGTRIPVLRRADTGEELGWPFDENAVIDFLR